MTSRSEVLRDVMLETRTTQSDLSRISEARRPSISRFLSGRVDLSDDQLSRLPSCMGFRLEVVRRPVVPQLTRSERRSWQLHRRLSSLLDRRSFEEWRPTTSTTWITSPMSRLLPDEQRREVLKVRG